MAQQGTGKSDGYFARAILGAVVNALLDYFHRDSQTVDDTNSVTLFDGEEIDAVGVVLDPAAGLHALVEFRGDDGAVNILSQSGAHYGTTAGTDAQVNLYYDTDHYELENQSGTDGVSFHALAVRIP